MITRFECPGLVAMLAVVLLHRVIERQVARRATGYIGAALVRSWRTRTVLSITLWRDLDSVYSMGEIPRHIHASRLPARMNITTRAGVFPYAGDWRHVMFDAGVPKSSPLEH